MSVFVLDMCHSVLYFRLVFCFGFSTLLSLLGFVFHEKKTGDSPKEKPAVTWLCCLANQVLILVQLVQNLAGHFWLVCFLLLWVKLNTGCVYLDSAKDLFSSFFFLICRIKC